MRVEIAPHYVPHRFQRQVHNCGKRFVAMSAGTRGGKTMAGAVEFVRRIALDLRAGRGRTAYGRGKDRRARLHYWVVSPVSWLLKEPKRYLLEMLPSELLEDPLRPINHEGQMWLKGDILIEFKSADDPRKLVSVGLNGAWVDEAARVPPETWTGNLRGRLADHRGWCLFSSTPLGENHYYLEIVKKGIEDSGEYDPEYTSITWHTADNPAIAREEVDAARRTMPWRMYRREFEADFTAFAGMVYDEWDERVHVVEESEFRREHGFNGGPMRTLFRRVVAGIDWGTNHPAAIVVVGDLGERMVVLDEVYEANKIVFDPRPEVPTLHREAVRLREKWGIAQFVADPSRPDNVRDFQRAGLPVTGADNDVFFGVRKVGEWLHPVDGAPRMRVLAHCKNVRREMKAYQWKPNRDGSAFTDEPQKENDDAMDALRYAVVDLTSWEPTRLGVARPRTPHRWQQPAYAGPVY